MLNSTWSSTPGMPVRSSYIFTTWYLSWQEPTTTYVSCFEFQPSQPTLTMVMVKPASMPLARQSQFRWPRERVDVAHRHALHRGRGMEQERC